MHNVKIETKDGLLIVTMAIDKPTIDRAPRSKTGKTQLVASTHGAVSIAGPDGSNLSLSLNLMEKG